MIPFLQSTFRSNPLIKPNQSNSIQVCQFLFHNEKTHFFYILLASCFGFLPGKIPGLWPLVQGPLNETVMPEDTYTVKPMQGKIIKLEPGFDLTEQEIEKFKIWPSGIIPYYIDVYSFSDKVLRDRIRSFLNMVNSVTSVNFLELPSAPKDEESRWVFFVNRRGLLNCADHYTNFFTTSGVQQVVLGYECMSTGNELAEAVLAIVGVPAQHTSPDRDKYIKVVNRNIMPDKKYLFEKLKYDEWLFYDIKYDYASAGHYHPHKHSSTGRATIEIKAYNLDILIGETNGFSEKDILKIKMLYNFISKKKQNITDCYKLFVPGTDFNTYRPDKKIMKSRKKPSQYLGLPADLSIEDKDDKQIEEFKTENREVKSIEKKEKVRTDDYNDDDNELNDASGVNSDDNTMT